VEALPSATDALYDDAAAPKLAANMRVDPLELEWQRIGCSYRTATGTKVVLQDVYGRASPGEMQVGGAGGGRGGQAGGGVRFGGRAGELNRAWSGAALFLPPPTHTKTHTVWRPAGGLLLSQGPRRQSRERP
jgi:hypothetical protein